MFEDFVIEILCATNALFVSRINFYGRWGIVCMCVCWWVYYMILYVNVIMDLESSSRHGCNKRVGSITNSANPRLIMDMFWYNVLVGTRIPSSSQTLVKKSCCATTSGKASSSSDKQRLAGVVRTTLRSALCTDINFRCSGQNSILSLIIQYIRQ